MKRASVVVVLAAGLARADGVRVTMDDPNESADAYAWRKLPALMLEVAGDVAERAVRRTVAEVLAEEGVTVDGASVGVVEPDDDSTVENGISIYFTDKPHWCGPLPGAGVFCYETRSMCAKKSKACRATKNVACMSATAHTTGEDGVFCRRTYGECEWTRRQIELTGEFALGECYVERQRAKR